MTSDAQGRAAQGVQFPAVDGKRSTSDLARAVFADATRAVAPEVARSVEQARQWHRDYVQAMVDVEAASAASAKHALAVAADGLDSLRSRLTFVDGSGEVPLSDALRGSVQTGVTTESVRGTGERQAQAEVPYRGQVLAGDALLRQLDAWVAADVVEPSFALAIGAVVANPGWVDCRDLTFALIGAAAEMGPIEWLPRWGATVIALDIARPAVWERILSASRAGAGVTHLPVRGDGPLAHSAGIDLLTELPATHAWLTEFAAPLVIGNYAYADGADFVRVAAAADALSVAMLRAVPETALAFLASPTDVFAVPSEVVDATRAGRKRRRRGSIVGGPLRSLTGGKMFTPNYQQTVDTDDGRQFGLADCIVPQQGPNYALAKRLQRWRAVLAHESHVTSANVAPATKTRSVVKNRVLAAAYAGAPRFGVEIFQTETSAALMALKLIHDLRSPQSAASPDTALGHPLELFTEGAAHGGLWRLPWEPRSVLPIAAVEGLIRRG